MAHKRELQLITLVFTSDFGSKKAGEEGCYNTMMASDILRKAVAVIKPDQDKEKKPDEPVIKKPKKK